MSDIETNTEERLIELLRLVYKLGIIHAKQDQNILNKKALIKMIERSKLLI
ncbi:hypothetical protein LCGC14_1838380 [marine sediment metagenome]|uniref:Uncharacterized protein n=1 Tax=marine sediment metagenome TaxID=412755 RepID=A0A0F9GE34_9ZZZZ